MSTQSVQIVTFDYGASLSSVTLRNKSTDVLVATADSCAEVTADSGLYLAVFGGVSVIPTGDYRLRAVIGGKPLNRYVTLAGVDTEVAVAASEPTAVLDSASQGDWTAEEKAQIRHQLGIDGTATAPTAPVTDPVVITPSDTGKTTLYALCVDRRGAAKSGVVVHCWLAGTRPAGSGIIADNLAETFTSGVNGVVQIPDRMLGFSYAVSVNSAENPVIVRISPNAGGTTAIPDLIS